MSSSIRNFISWSLSGAAIIQCLKILQKCLIFPTGSISYFALKLYSWRTLQKILEVKIQMWQFVDYFGTLWFSAAFQVGRTWMFDFLVSGYWIWSLSSHCFQFSPTSRTKHMMSRGWRFPLGSSLERNGSSFLQPNILPNSQK